MVMYINRLDPKTLRVRLGQKDIPGRPDTVPMKVDVTPVDASDFFGIDRILIHQNYDPVSHLNDIAVLHLNRIVEFSLGVLRICLPPPTVGTFEDKEAIVAGTVPIQTRIRRRDRHSNDNTHKMVALCTFYVRLGHCSFYGFAECDFTRGSSTCLE